MKDVFARLGADFFSTIVFLAIYLVTDNVMLATGVAIAGAIAQVIYSRVKGKELGYMTWASLALVIVLGSATLLDPRSALRAGEARDRAFRDRRHHAQARLDAALYAADRDRDHSGICHLRGLCLGRAVFVLGAGTIAVAMTGDMKLWTFYVTVVLVGAKIAAFAMQYVAFRVLVGSRIRAAARAPEEYA